MTVAKLRPFLIRPGGHYECFGDGLCCTDVHALGPLDDDEKQRLMLVDEHVVHHNPLVDADVLTTSAGGRCVFRTDEGCALHTAMDGVLKPKGCWRYPVGITATPLGARVTLEHRCPCTLMGEGAALTEARAEAHLGEASGANHIVESIPTDSGEISLEEYAAIESRLLEAVGRATSEAGLLEVLGGTTFPTIEHSWDQLAAGMQSLSLGDQGGRFEAALHWFGAALETRGEHAKEKPRPWTASFERAEARTSEGDALAPFRTFVADQLWSLFWTATGSLRTTRQELSTRLVIGFAIARKLRELGTRADRAAAEAVMMLDVVGTSDWWQSVIAEIDRS